MNLDLRIGVVHRRLGPVDPSDVQLARDGDLGGEIDHSSHRPIVDHEAGVGQAAGMHSAVDLASVLSTVEQPWSPRTVAVLNDYDVRVVKTKGEFTRHSHPDTDEFFLVLSGSLTIRLDAGDVELGPGQVYVVPRGMQHQPVSIEGAEVMLIEPSETVNTGDTPGELTAARDVVES